MSNKRELAKQNKILEFRVGSHLYGTNTPTSDEDFSGVFIPGPEQLFGFNNVEQVDLSVVSKRNDGKNDQNAVDMVLYEFRKFNQLALANNPNILEMLFINEDNILFQNEFGKQLLEKSYLFPYQGLKERFIGYSMSQKKKMVIRTENFHDLKYADDFFNNLDNKYDKSLLIELISNPSSFNKDTFSFVNTVLKFKGDNIQIGDLKFQKHFMLRKVKKIVKERLSKVSNRKDLLLKYGYDTKFGSHLVRLLLEGVELLETGKLEFPLKDAQMLLDIKQGKWNMNDVINYGTDLENEIRLLMETTKLPKKPRYNEIQNFTINLIKEYYGYK